MPQVDVCSWKGTPDQMGPYPAQIGYMQYMIKTKSFTRGQYQSSRSLEVDHFQNKRMDLMTFLFARLGKPTKIPRDAPEFYACLHSNCGFNDAQDMWYLFGL